MKDFKLNAYSHCQNRIISMFTLNIIIYWLLFLPSNLNLNKNSHVSMYYESVLHCGD